LIRAGLSVNGGSIVNEHKVERLIQKKTLNGSCDVTEMQIAQMLSDHLINHSSNVFNAQCGGYLYKTRYTVFFLNWKSVQCWGLLHFCLQKELGLVTHGYLSLFRIWQNQENVCHYNR